MLTPSEIDAIMQQVVDRFLLPRFQSLGMKATGEWQASLEVRAEGNNGGTIRGRDYSEWLAKGAGPHSAPVSALKRWAMAKFGVDEKKATGIAWAVRQKIKQRGTSWYEQGGSTLVEVLEEPATLEFVEEKIGEATRLKIEENLVRTAQDFEAYINSL